MRIGYFSLPVVGLTAFFTGGVLALQIYLGGNRYGAEAFVPQIVVLGITRELGPVLAGLMVAGRVGAAIAAEIGTMRVTEQIDALTTLSTNPFKYLVVPRLIAAVIIACRSWSPSPIPSASSAAMSSATQSLGFNGCDLSQEHGRLRRRIEDVTSGLIKAAVFGFIIALMGCYNGFNSKGGAQGVGAATTNAVVSVVDPDPRRQLSPHLHPVREVSAMADTPRSNCAASRSASARRSCWTASILTLEQGQSLVVIGGSGTGKSVMIKCILGILRPDAGQILVDGEEVTRIERPRARRDAAQVRHAVPGRGAVRLACRSGRTSPSA